LLGLAYALAVHIATTSSVQHIGRETHTIATHAMCETKPTASKTLHCILGPLAQQRLASTNTTITSPAAEKVE
jgi:hypothetical protein